MIDVIEDVRNEFKVKLTDKLENEVISFLNSDGGNIFIGVADDGTIIGLNGNIDLLQRSIKDKIKTNIMPSTLGLFDVVVNERNHKKIIQIIIAKGNEAPYYLKGMGMTPDSCFIRVGSSVESMNSEMILNTFSKRVRSSLRNILSPKQELNFTDLKIYYKENDFEVNDNFLKQLNLYNDDNKFNYIAYLLSDNNNISIQFAKYSGNDVGDLIENEDYGHCSLIKATNNIINKLKLENKTFTKIEDTTRKEIKMYEFSAVKEVVTNAMVHNDWTNGYSPKFEIFSNKLVISSNGGIQEGVTQEEFLLGFSNPRNPELIRVFTDLNLVEQLSTEIQRTLKYYDKSIFEFFPNHITVNIPIKKNNLNKNDKNHQYLYNIDISNIDNSIIKLITDKPDITQEELANILNVNIRTIKRHFKELIEDEYIIRDGANKNGYWKINM